MGLFICHICEEHLNLDEPGPHVCNHDKLVAKVQSLTQERNDAQRKLDDIRLAVKRVLLPVDSLAGEKTEVETEYLRKLWDAAECRWYESKSADNYLVCKLAHSRVLTEAFALFRERKWGDHTPITLLTKLKRLKEECDRACEVFGWKNTFTLTPEQVAAGVLDTKAMMADFIEHAADDLVTKYEHWLFDFSLEKPEEAKVIGEFVKWYREEAEKALHVGRGQDNVSFSEARRRIRNQDDGQASG